MIFTRPLRYDPHRWLSRDPIAEKGEINLYGYVGNNPINAIDSMGLAKITIFSQGPTFQGTRVFICLVLADGLIFSELIQTVPGEGKKGFRLLAARFE
jgi:uncharacterized protein RhaS with RHS repeats